MTQVPPPSGGSVHTPIGRITTPGIFFFFFLITHATAEVMGEQLAERLQNGERPTPPSSSTATMSMEESAALDPDLALALALSLSEQ
jgi:hypothetical protein